MEGFYGIQLKMKKKKNIYIYIYSEVLNEMYCLK